MSRSREGSDDLELCLYDLEILQNHHLCAFVANLKIDAIYALYLESFCDKNLAIWKVFTFCDSAWNEAEAFCQQKNGHLASNAINEYVFEGPKRRDRLWLAPCNIWWVGGNDIDEEGTWEWTDCSPFEFTA